MVQRCETTLVGYGKRQQVSVCDLVVAQYPRPVHQFRLPERDVVRPELVIKFGADVSQLRRNNLESDGANSAVSGHVQNPDDPVLDKRAGRDPEPACLEEVQNPVMKDVPLVKQRDPDIDIEQMADRA